MADFFHFVPGYQHYVYRAGREPLLFLLLAFMLGTVTAQTSQSEQAEPAVSGNTPEHVAAEVEIKGMIAELRSLSAAGKTLEAEPLARRAVARAEELFGPKHGYSGAAAGILGRLLRSTNRAGEASPWLFKALVVASNIFSIGDDRYKNAVGELVETLVAVKDFDSATSLFKRIIASATTSPGLALVEAYYRSEYGSMLRRLGKFAAAETEFRSALALREKGFAIEEKQVRLDQQLKEIGVFDVVLHLHQGVDATIKVWVVQQKPQ